MRINWVKIISVASLFISSAFFGASLTGFYTPQIAIGKNSEKEIHRALFGPQQGKIIDTRWSAFGQTDLVAFDNSPEYMDIYIDGTAGTPMFKFNGNFSSPDSTVTGLKTKFPGYFPFIFLRKTEKEKALIIGPGGGRDILLAVMGGVQNITAVEVNKDLVEMVREYAGYNGHIYDGFDNVNIIVAEGRNFLKRQKEIYDIIMLSLPVTNTSRSREGYAMTENFLLTTDSISDYLDHLTDDGRVIVIGHGELSMLRLLSISLAALSKRDVGLKEGMKHIYILGSGLFPVFVIKKTPFLKEEVLPRFQAIFKFGYDPLSSYFPFVQKWGMLNPALMSIESGRSDLKKVEKAAEALGHDISPVSDNSPFFYKFENGTPKPVYRVFVFSIIATLFVMMMPLLVFQKDRSKKRIYSKDKREGGGNPIPYAAVFLMLGMGFMMVEISLIQRFVLFLGRPVVSLAVLLFSLLGIGFMLIEIPLIQQFILFLGQPVYAVAMLLFSLLIGAGVGSWISGVLWKQRTTIKLRLAAFMVSLIVVIYTLFLNQSLVFFMGANFWVRILVSFLLLMPLGFFMGMPFPLGMKLLSEFGLENYVPRMWAVNGIGSVLGSALSIALSISFGFSYAMTLGALLYFSMFILFYVTLKPFVKFL